MFRFLFLFCSFALWFLFSCKALGLNAFLQCAPIKTTDLTGSQVIPLVVHLTCLSKTCLKGDVWRLVVIHLFYEMDLAGKTKIFKGPVKAALSLGKRVTQLALFFLRFLSPQ